MDAVDYRCATSRFRFYVQGIISCCLKVTPAAWVSAMLSLRSPRQEAVSAIRHMLEPSSPEVMTEQAHLVKLMLRRRMHNTSELKEARGTSWNHYHKKIRAALTHAGATAPALPVATRFLRMKPGSPVMHQLYTPLAVSYTHLTLPTIYSV